MQRLADRLSLRTSMNRWQSLTLGPPRPASHPLPLCSLGLQPHPQGPALSGRGRGDEGISQWSSIFTGAGTRAPLLESPPPPAGDGGAKCGCQLTPAFPPHNLHTELCCVASGEQAARCPVSGPLLAAAQSLWGCPLLHAPHSSYEAAGPQVAGALAKGRSWRAAVCAED